MADQEKPKDVRPDRSAEEVNKAARSALAAVMTREELADRVAPFISWALAEHAKPDALGRSLGTAAR